MSVRRPPVVRICGRKGHGKTTLVTELARWLTYAGWSVGAIKHTPHAHPLDVAGKDSARFGEAGARPWAFTTESGTALFLPRDGGSLPELLRFFDRCDLVLVEGWLEGSGPLIEVFRAAIDPVPLAAERGDVDLIVTDDPLPAGLRVLPRRDLPAIARAALALAGLDAEARAL